MAPPASDDDVSAGSILRELIFNQYQAIVLGGTAVVSLLAANPLPLLIWLGSELVLLPILDSGPLRRLVNRKKREVAKAQAAAARSRLIGDLSAEHAKKYAALEDLCGQIEANYGGLTGISQAYLAEQRAKLDMILAGALHRLHALQRYQRMPARRRAEDIEREIRALEAEIAEADVSERTAAALQKNLELKRRLLASVSQVGDTVRMLQTEIDSIQSLLEVLHQNSMSLRDPQAISQELDTIVRQSEDSERIVREMEALLRTDMTGFQDDVTASAVTVPPIPGKAGADPTSGRQRVKRR
jgi:DNA repair exonuclease SbcCD ATPase subunit